MRIELRPGIKLYEHQQGDLRFLLGKRRAGNFSEMGAMKTLSAAIACAGLVQDKIADKAVLVMPAQLLYDWKDVFDLQMVCPLKVHVYHGSSRSIIDAFNADVIIISYQVLVNEVVKKHRNKDGSLSKNKRKREIDVNSPWVRFFQKNKVVLLGDEASGFRRPESKRTFAFASLSRMASRTYLLSGNPAPNGPENYFPIMFMLKPEVYPNKQTFYDMHCIVHGRDNVVGYKNLDILQAHIASVSVRHLKRECLDLPPVTFVVRELESLPAHKQLYDSAMDNEFLELPDGRVLDMTSVFSITTRARQLATNPCTLGFDVPNVLFNQLEDDLEYIGREGHKVVVFNRFVDTGYRIKALAESAGWNVACMFDTQHFNAEKEKRRFQSDPDCNMIVVNPASGGLGINLSMAQYNIFFEYDYDLDQHDQALERSNRRGLAGPLTVLYYVVKNTICEAMLEVLQKKKKLSSDMLRDPVYLCNFVKYKKAIETDGGINLGL